MVLEQEALASLIGLHPQESSELVLPLASHLRSILDRLYQRLGAPSHQYAIGHKVRLRPAAMSFESHTDRLCRSPTLALPNDVQRKAARHHRHRNNQTRPPLPPRRDSIHNLASATAQLLIRELEPGLVPRRWRASVIGKPDRIEAIGRFQQPPSQLLRPRFLAAAVFIRHGRWVQCASLVVDAQDEVDRGGVLGDDLPHREDRAPDADPRACWIPALARGRRDRLSRLVDCG